MDWFFEFPELGRKDLRDFRKGIDEGFKNFTRTHGEAIETFFDPLLQFLIFLIILKIICIGYFMT